MRFTGTVLVASVNVHIAMHVLSLSALWSIPLHDLPVNFAAVWRLDLKPKCSKHEDRGRREVPVHFKLATALILLLDSVEELP